MTRGISAATLAALELDNAQPIYFVELRIDETSSPQVIDRLHTGLGTITWGGFNWTGAGDLSSIESVREEVGLSPQALRMSLSGVDSTVTNLVFGTNYYRRPVKMYLGALSAGALIEDPSIVFSGFIESIDMVIGGEDGDTVSLTAESELILFKRSRSVRYTDNQLQSEYSGDLGLQFVESTAIQKVVWRGRNNPLGSREAGRGPAGGGTNLSPYRDR